MKQDSLDALVPLLFHFAVTGLHRNVVMFNSMKCKVRHQLIETNNKNFFSKTGTQKLESVEEERDVSVLVDYRIALFHLGGVQFPGTVVLITAEAAAAVVFSREAFTCFMNRALQ